MQVHSRTNIRMTKTAKVTYQTHPETKTEPVRGKINFKHFPFKSQYSADKDIIGN